MEIRKMKRIKKLNNITNDTGYNTDYDTASAFIPSSIKNRALFLDIETTGFSAAKARLYLIGTAYVQDHVLVTEQFFAETGSPDEEAALIYEFDSLAAQFDTIVTFYGSRFDLPFLKECQKRLHIPPADLVYHNKNYVDLYVDFHAYKHIFALENYKLLSLEAFLGIKRMETRSGGELAGIYMEYIKKTDDESLRLLLSHNYEDLTGMVRLLPLYAFDSFFAGHFTPVSSTVSTYCRIDGTPGTELSITCLLEHSLPAAVSCCCCSYYLHAGQNTAIFRVPLYQGELKYFYPNYKDYYYLPGEDTAIHKSVAAYVDRAHRQKARAASCYTRKTGSFLVQYEELITPAFYTEYKAGLSYFELPDESGRSTALLKDYCMHMLHILKNPPKAEHKTSSG